MRRSDWRACALVTFALALATPLSVRAAFGIDPTLITLQPGDRVATVKINNTSIYPRSYEAKIFSWTQIGHVRHLDPTDDVIVSPPIFTLDAGETQTIRLGLRHPADRDVEQSFRLTVGELPQGTVTGSRIDTLMKVSVPVFFRPDGAPGTARPSFTLDRTTPLSGTLLIDNAERVHVHLDRLRLTDRARSVVFESSATEYILPKQELKVPVRLNHLPDGAIVAHVTTDDAEFDVPVKIVP